MAHEKVYGICENMCQVEVTKKETVDQMQEEINEINTDLSDGISDLTNKISDKSNKIIVETKTGSMTMGGTYSLGAVSIAIAKSGYTPIAIGSIQISNSHGMPVIGRYFFTNTTFTMDCHSAVGTVPYTETVTIKVVYMKN